MSIDSIITLCIVALAASLVARGALLSLRRHLAPQGSSCGGCRGCDESGAPEATGDHCTRGGADSGRVHLPIARDGQSS